MVRRLEAAASRVSSPAAGAIITTSNPGGSGLFRYHILPAAGHWVHTDNGPGLQKMMLDAMMIPQS